MSNTITDEVIAQVGDTSSFGKTEASNSSWIDSIKNFGVKLIDGATAVSDATGDFGASLQNTFGLFNGGEQFAEDPVIDNSKNVPETVVNTIKKAELSNPPMKSNKMLWVGAGAIGLLWFFSKKK